MRNALCKKLCEFAEKDKDVLLLVGDLGYGAFNEYMEKYPDRFVNCGIAEQNMMSVAAGMAALGKKVFVYSIGSFSTLRCLEQIRNDVAYHDLPVTVITVGAGVEYGSLGMSHHVTEDIAAIRMLPNMAVYSPYNVKSCEKALDEIYAKGKPAYIRLNKSGIDGVYSDCADLVIDKILDGNEKAVITTGTIADQAILAGKEAAAAVYAIAKLKPLDKERVATELKKYSEIVTVEEHNKIGGLGSAMAELICEFDLDIKLKVVAIDDVYTSEVGKRDYLRAFYKIDKAAITDALKR